MKSEAMRALYITLYNAILLSDLKQEEIANIINAISGKKKTIQQAGSEIRKIKKLENLNASTLDEYCQAFKI